MMSCVSILMLATTLGQVPTDPDWLNRVPPEADLVVRVRGLVAVKDDLTTMLRAMSPKLAATAEPMLEQGIAMAKTEAGLVVASEPLYLMLRGVPGEKPGSPPFAIIVKSSNYEETLKSIAGGEDPAIRTLDAGYDSFKSSGGQTWYASRGAGSVAFGPDKILIDGYRKQGERSLGTTIPPNLRKKFLARDIGVYVNVHGLMTRYAEPIAKGEQDYLAMLDKMGAPLGAGTANFFKSSYGKVFELIKDVDLVAMSLEFSADGYEESDIVTFKADSKSARAIARAETSDAVQLGRLAVDSSYYAYMNLDAETFKSIQIMSMQMYSPGGKVSPELEAAIGKERGRIEMIGAASMGDGIRSFQIANLTDPNAVLDAYVASVKLMNKADSPLNFVKEIKTVPNAEAYRGFSFTQIEMTIDFDKFAKLEPKNPAAGTAAIDTMKAMYGGDKITTWIGVGETQMIQVMAPNWSEARTRIDGYLQGDNHLGTTAGYKVTRSRLPEKVSFLALISAQGFVRQVAAELAATAPHALQISPSDMPKAPVLIGFSVAPAGPNSVGFQLFVPSSVGPVIEKGLVPVISSLQPPAKP
jgi:hypothetical protein